MYTDAPERDEHEAWVAAFGERLYDGDAAYAGVLRAEGDELAVPFPATHRRSVYGRTTVAMWWRHSLRRASQEVSA